MKKKFLIFNLIFIIFITSLNFNSFSYGNPIVLVEGAEAFAGLITIIAGSEVVTNKSVANKLYEQYKEINEDVGFLTTLAKAHYFYCAKQDFMRVSDFVRDSLNKEFTFFTTSLASAPALSSSSIGVIEHMKIESSFFQTAISSNKEVLLPSGHLLEHTGSFAGSHSFDLKIYYKNAFIFTIPISDVDLGDYFTLHLELHTLDSMTLVTKLYSSNNALKSSSEEPLFFEIPATYVQFLTNDGILARSKAFVSYPALETHYNYNDTYYDNKRFKDGILFPAIPAAAFNSDGVSLPISKNIDYDITKDLTSLDIWGDSLEIDVPPQLDVGFLKKLIDKLTEMVNKIISDLGILTGRVDTLDSNVGVLTQDVYGTRDIVDSLGRDVVGLRENVGTLGKDVIGLNNRINDVEKDSTNTKDKVISLGKDVSINTEKVGNLEKEVGKLKTQSNSPPFLPTLTDIKELIRKLLDLLSKLFDMLKSFIDTILKFFDVTNFSLDFSKLKVSIKTKFPFCIPFDFYNAIKLFQASMKEPQIRVKIDYLHLDYMLQLGPINYARMFFRYIAVVWYAIFLMGKTRDFIKW